MAKIISNLGDAISYINTLYNGSSEVPTEGDEDYTVWTALLNVGIDLWENEEGVLWKELFVKLADAATGDKVTSVGDYSYTVPTDFRFPASAYVWIGSGTNKTAFKIIDQEDVQLRENDSGNWCYFLQDATPTLEFNPNASISGGTLSYNYYKNASAVTTEASTFEMADPMFAVFYAVSELKKEEGDTSALSIAQQKLEGMRTKNIMPAWYQADSYLPMNGGMGV